MACHLCEKKDVCDGNDMGRMLQEKWQMQTISRANVAGIQRQRYFGEGCWVVVVEPEQDWTKGTELGPAERSGYRGHSMQRESEELRNR